MRDEEVPDAWADAVYSVLHRKLNGGPYMMPPDVLDEAARAALAAVAPLIAAAERERCAKVADARFAEHKKAAEEACFGRPQNLVLLSVSQFRYAMAEEISAAIRAQGDA